MRVTLDQKAVRILSHHNPIGSSLRRVVATLKMSSTLERVGDLAKGVAKRVAAELWGLQVRPSTAQSLAMRLARARALLNAA